MKKEDKRSQKTVKAIQDALLRMLADTNLSDIKIIDLCRVADINRTTFYLHYDNVDQVQRSIREAIVERIFESYQEESFLYTLEYPIHFLTTCTEVLSSYEGFENFVRNSSEAAYFLEEFKKTFSARACAEYCNEYHEKTEGAFFIINFMTAGTLDNYIMWLRSDKQIPLSYIFDQCADMFAAAHVALSKIKTTNNA